MDENSEALKTELLQGILIYTYQEKINNAINEIIAHLLYSQDLLYKELNKDNSSYMKQQFEHFLNMFNKILKHKKLKVIEKRQLKKDVTPPIDNKIDLYGKTVIEDGEYIVLIFELQKSFDKKVFNVIFEYPIPVYMTSYPLLKTKLSDSHKDKLTSQ